MKGGKSKDATSNKADNISDFFEFSSILRFLQGTSSQRILHQFSLLAKKIHVGLSVRRKERRRRAGSLRRGRNWRRIRLQTLSSFSWRSFGSSSRRRIRKTNLLLLK